MIDAACARWDIDLARSWVIGDRDIDVQMGVAVGGRGVLVRTGYGEREWRTKPGAFPEGTPVVMNLMAAAVLILTEGDAAA